MYAWKSTKKEVIIIGTRKKQRQQLRRELEAYREAGLKLWLNGRPSGPDKIAEQCIISEANEYMRDFVRDEQEQIIGIGFDFINRH